MNHAILPCIHKVLTRTARCLRDWNVPCTASSHSTPLPMRGRRWFLTFPALQGSRPRTRRKHANVTLKCVTYFIPSSFQGFHSVGLLPIQHACAGVMILAGAADSRVAYDRKPFYQNALRGIVINWSNCNNAGEVSYARNHPFCKCGLQHSDIRDSCAYLAASHFGGSPRFPVPHGAI